VILHLPGDQGDQAHLERNGTMGIDSISQIDLAESILKANGCRIQSFLSHRQTQYVIKYGIRSISPSFFSIKEVCEWVVTHTKDIAEELN